MKYVALAVAVALAVVALAFIGGFQWRIPAPPLDDEPGSG